jgi:TetR/AcrR family transcriptional regulator, cholesterol catabolism regulator
VIEASGAANSGTKAARTRQRILEAAAHELAEHGYAGTSLRNVAAGAGLHIGSLYFHFSSKDELVAEAMREGIEFAYLHVRTALDQAPPATTPENRLRIAIDAHLQALHANHDRAAAVVQMVTTLPAGLRSAHISNERRYGGLWLAILQDAQQAGLIDDGANLRQVRNLLLGALNSTMHTVRSPSDELGPITTTAMYLLTGHNGA